MGNTAKDVMLLLLPVKSVFQLLGCADVARYTVFYDVIQAKRDTRFKARTPKTSSTQSEFRKLEQSITRFRHAAGVCLQV